MAKPIMRRSIVLWLCLFGVCLYEAEATLKTIFLEDLCSYKRSATILLSEVPSGILMSLPPRNSEPFECTVTILPQYGQSVVLSIYSYYVDLNTELTIEDSDRYKVALLRTGSFPDERKSIVSDGKIIIRYKRSEEDSKFNGPSVNETDNETARGFPVPGFQFTFTQTRDSPCRSKEFQCDNGKCINEEYVCDGHNHCGDNSNKKKCSFKKDQNIRSAPPSNSAAIWISTIVVGGIVLVILVIIYIIILVRISKKKAANASTPNGTPLETVSSTLPANQAATVNPATSASVPRDEASGTSLYDRVRRSIHRPTGTRVEEPMQQQSAESYQVPSMYPRLDHIPSAPALQGTDNPEFRIEE